MVSSLAEQQWSTGYGLIKFSYSSTSRLVDEKNESVVQTSDVRVGSRKYENGSGGKEGRKNN